MNLDYGNILTERGYRLVTRVEFFSMTNLPGGLLDRARNFPGDFVVYDPLDDEDGWLLVGDNPEQLARETVEQRCS